MMRVLATSDNGPIILGMPSVSGSTFGFERLVSVLDIQCTAIAFEDPMLTGGPTLDTVTSLSEHFVSQFTATKNSPSRNIVVFGYSFGSRLAVEFARDLIAWDDLSVVLVGPGRVHNDWGDNSLDDAAIFHGYIDKPEDDVRAMQKDERDSYIMNKFCSKLAVPIDDKTSKDEATRRMGIFRKNTIAMAKCETEKINRPGLVLESVEEPDTSEIFLDWSEIFSSFEAKIVSGGHTTMFTNSSYLKQVAEQVSRSARRQSVDT